MIAPIDFDFICRLLIQVMNHLMRRQMRRSKELFATNITIDKNLYMSVDVTHHFIQHHRSSHTIGPKAHKLTHCLIFFIEMPYFVFSTFDPIVESFETILMFASERIKSEVRTDVIYYCITTFGLMFTVFYTTVMLDRSLYG
jgi:hypothetical protein